MSLAERVQNLTERLNPQPPLMETIVMVHFGDPIQEDAILPNGWHRIGPHYRATFLGGTEKERARMLKQFRRDPIYQRPPYRDETGAGD